MLQGALFVRIVLMNVMKQLEMPNHKIKTQK